MNNVEKLARFRLRKTKNVDDATLMQEMQRIQTDGISQAEFMAMDEPLDMKKLVKQQDI